MGEKKKLKTLEEHNHEIFKENNSYFDANPLLNGIACPRCGEELYDIDPLTVLTSAPPQKAVGCSACGFRGFRYC